MKYFQIVNILNITAIAINTMYSRAPQPHQPSYPEPKDCPGLLFQPPGWWLMIALMLVFLVLFDQFLVPIMILVILCYLTEDSSKVATSNDQDGVFGKRQVLGSDHPLKKSLNNTNAIEFVRRFIHFSITTPFLAREAHSWSLTVWNWEEALCSFAGSSTIAPDHYDKTYICHDLFT